MYELNHVAGGTYYINCPAKIGIYADGENAWLIDSGNDKEAGKKVQKILAENNWTLMGIINTHSNADHIGGNKLLIDRLGCTAYSTPAEAAINEFTQLEPSILYGGYPCKPLRNKFLMAQSSPCSYIGEAPLPEGLKWFRLGGHFLDMIGVKTPDGVYFLSDCMSGENIVEKYHVNFIYDVRAYLETLDMVCTLEGDVFIPAHAEPTGDIRPLAELNRRKVLEIIELLLELCEEPASPDDIIKRVFDHYELSMDFGQYVLVGSTLRSYLSYLADEGKLRPEFVENRLLWSAVREDA